tara:strand:+ start:935 stop:2356 length:1422 start_codon:yes stop_codon:yes gene_type:complete
MDKTGQTLNNMSELLKLQLKVAEIAEENKKKVAALQAKFEKVEAEAYDECPVCYGSISVKNACCMPNCDHKMCKNCYYNWLDKQEKNTCPMCREEVFKNNLDIKTKRSVLQNHLDSLENEVAEMYHERRHIRNSIRDTQDEFAQVEDDVNKLYDKHDQLRDEIFDKQQLVTEMNEYKKNPEAWRIRKEQRLKQEIKKGYLTWRGKYDKLKKELLVECEFRVHCNNYKEEGYQKELNRIYSITYAKHMINVDLSEIEVDLSETNMFELPPEFTGVEDEPHMLMHLDPWYRTAERDPRSAHRDKFEDSLHYIQNVEIKYKSAINYGWWKQDEEDGYDTDETTSMPDLIEASDQELEDMALEGTTFEQDELEYDRAALNVPSPLEEGEIPEPINTGRYNIINDQGTITQTFNYIHRSPTGGWQQTDDSYRPRRLTYPENTTRRLFLEYFQPSNTSDRMDAIMTVIDDQSHERSARV